MADKWVHRWYEPSDSNPEKLYTVAIDAEGSWGCSCRGWTGHTPRKDCKHIKRVKARVGENPSALNAMSLPQPKATVVSSADLQDKWATPTEKRKPPAQQPTTRAMFLEF